MTRRRWQQAGEDPQEEHELGPVEIQVQAELNKLGWDAGIPGPLATAAAICLSLAETLDRTNAARDVAALSRELSARLREARESTGGRRLSVVEQAAARQSRRSAGTADPRRSAG